MRKAAWRFCCRLAAAMILFAAVGCGGGCSEREKLEDVRCRPGNPATGRFDPELAELCNGIDDNCDQRVDEGCSCRDGEMQVCGEIIGICRTSTVVCAGGVFPACTPEVVPRVEACNGLDDDCNGIVDDGIATEEYWPESVEIVVFADTSSVSICRKGHMVCDHGRMAEQRDEVLPKNETCNGLDDDCNGIVDDVPPVACGRDVGICRPGEMRCISRDWRCVDLPTTVHPREVETCNGLDDNCSGGVPDEGIEPEPCVNVQCGTRGYRYCVSGRMSACDAPGPIAREICGNGLDDNCNGQAEEGCPCPNTPIRVCDRMVVGSPFPDCGYGTERCTGEGEWGTCRYAGNYPGEICNSHDDDCNGRIDEGLTRRCGNMSLDHIGQCRTGSSACEFGNWGPCRGEVVPETEICDGVDNNCNGLSDEGLNQRDKVDMLVLVDVSQSMCTYSLWLAQGMAMYAADFVGARNPDDHRFGLGLFPNTFLAPWNVQTIVQFADPNILTNAASFQHDVLRAVHCAGGGMEPSYDALWVATSSTNPARIPWRPDATPYVVIITDESAQRYVYPPNVGGDPMSTQLAIGAQTNPCRLPGCGPASRLEIFVITNTNFFSDYETIVYHDAARLMNIEPATPQHYAAIMRQIFREICRRQGP